MDLEQLIRRAVGVADLYDRLNLQERGRAWTTEQLALGFVGDVGDLAKLVMADAGTRDIEDHRDLLGHELADCLWSVLVIAARSGIDLEQEFDRCMSMLTEHIDGRLR
ncbi:MazG nucleotide pyrophosphohydrolase domain-containing protein [Luteipulveratus mongoliensis]|uniref:Nucleotide pyrophosphohydrolase n=1 Tax=Luteipulveratus mongoliensis TaxID=571913 RepID=A0A0K1JL28_9MICO|nr:MazG nucleotide pyrophosphohydrolase domain-containing protein [Luteipulveratus mongoliensis]AKU17270.1 nucleotide pyrophosphohydrolase [Luteipulveratus mongoliensis]